MLRIHLSPMLSPRTSMGLLAILAAPVTVHQISLAMHVDSRVITLPSVPRRMLVVDLLSPEEVPILQLLDVVA